MQALLFDRLVDKEVGVRIAACGALRNMCDAASVVLSEQLLARDILTILFANLEKANAELLAVAAKESEPPRPEQSVPFRTIWVCVCLCLYLLVCMCTCKMLLSMR